MLTTLSILSRDQGKLRPSPETEAAHFARFQKAPPAAKPHQPRFTAASIRALFGHRADLQQH